MQCRSIGNPFNTTIIPSPPLSSPSPSSFGSLPPDIGPGIQVFDPSPESPHSSGKLKSLTTKIVVWVAIGGFLILIVLAFGLCFCLSQRRKEKSKVNISKSGQPKNSTVNTLKPSEHRENGKLALVLSVRFLLSYVTSMIHKEKKKTPTLTLVVNYFFEVDNVCIP